MNSGKIYLLVTIVALSLSVSTSAQLFASQSFYAYDGPVKPLLGSGGAKTVKHEIEYWVDGAPARPFRIVGVMVDSRSDRWFSGNAVGSKAIAKKVKEAGGNGVIILNQQEKITSVVSNYYGSSSGTATLFGNSASYSGSNFGFGSAEAVSNVKTRLYVIAYMNGEAKADASDLAGDAKAQSSAPMSVADLAMASGAPQLERPMAFVRNEVPMNAGPIKRPAKTKSGFCYDVPRNYVGSGSLNRPALTTYTPACWQLEQSS